MSSSPESIRVGVIGLGSMGLNHARFLQEGKVSGAHLAAICDPIAANLESWQNVAKFTDIDAMLQSGTVDAVVIVTPHFSHAPLSIAAFKAGLHVMVEKPLTVRKSDAERVIEAHKKSKCVFGVMLNMRTDPLYRQIHTWTNDGTLGPIQRIQCTVTDWFRSNAYYKWCGWRGSWAGEGGGVLMNLAPHQLDIWQWLFGMPDRVRAVGRLGRYHDIEVDDDVTAIFEYASGLTGVFTTTTGEAPGVNRIEIAADNGLLIQEGRTLRFLKNKMSTSEFNRTTTERYAKPETEETKLEFPEFREQHVVILKSFIETIRTGAPLLVPGEQGIRSVELSNALTYSLINDKPVDLPMDSSKFDLLLDSQIEKSKAQAKSVS